MKEHIETITDLLLGAAYADKRLEGQELSTIRELLVKVLQADALPEALEERVRSFNPAKLDVVTATATLQSLELDDKRLLLDLVATVNESDDEIDFDEDGYLRKVALGLGIPEDELDILNLEILSDEDLDGLLTTDE